MKLSKVIGQHGTAIGWKVTETYNLPNILRQAVMPVIDSDICRESNADFYEAYLTETSFCAGFQNGLFIKNY